MSTYGIKRSYQHTAETQPFAENLCVSSFLLTLRNGLVRYHPPEGGGGGCCLYPTKCMGLADTETQRWAGLDQDRNGSSDGRYI